MCLGLNIGTSGVKAILLDGSFREIGSAHAALTVSRQKPGWSEQNPDSWIVACGSTLGTLVGMRPPEMAALRGIGLPGHMHGATLLDTGDRPLRPCIVWYGGQSGARCAEPEARADFQGIGGNIVMAGFTAPQLL